jgi:DNA-binding NtrC family response regulator
MSTGPSADRSASTRTAPAAATHLTLMDEERSELDRLRQEVARHRHLLDRTLQVTVAQGMGEMAAELASGLLALTGACRVFVGAVEGSGWRILAARDADGREIADPAGEIQARTVAEALHSGKVVKVEDDSRLSKGGPLRVAACLPLGTSDRVLGFVWLDDPAEGALPHEDDLETVRRWLPLMAGCLNCAARGQGRGEVLGMATRSPAFLADLEELSRVASFDVSVLLSGETGTGKSLLARQIHAASPRAAGPFVHVNCGAIPEALVEGELFGAEAGAYTGSDSRRIGRFEAAKGGTLFFDELDSLPLACQVKLLVALQERVITRLGSNASVPVDVRVVAAISHNPAESIRSGRLREDLYYRVALFALEIPPLRERTMDLTLLSRTILERSRVRFGLPELRLTPAAEDALLGHDWPGNVRELENVLHRAALLSRDGCIDEAALRPSRRPAVRLSGDGPDGVLAALERAAGFFVSELMRRGDLADIGLTEVFTGAVLLELERRAGGRERAFEMLGLEAQVRNKNHHRVFRRELGRLQALARRLGEPVPEEGSKER